MTCVRIETDSRDAIYTEPIDLTRVNKRNLTIRIATLLTMEGTTFVFLHPHYID